MRWLFSIVVVALGLAAAGRAASDRPFAGFGADTPGGRGGRVIKVTNLDTAGAGSLRSALEADGPRIVVFEVGGIIDWRKDEVTVKNGRLTIAGETAPSPGITIIRGSLAISAADVIVRHIRLRLGDGGDLKAPNWDADCMGAVGPEAKNILFDHCSTAWSIDENLSVSGPRVKDGTASFVTLRQCIIAEGLDKSTHHKGPHSKGTLLHDFVHDVAIIGNLYAHDFNRNPMLKPNARAFMANNLIYDPGSAAIHFAYVPDEYKVIPHPMLPPELTAVGNVLRLGASAQPRLTAMFFGVGKLYQRDNRMFDRAGALVWDGSKGDKFKLVNEQVQIIAEPMLAPKDFTPLPAASVEEYVLRGAGARPKDRDPVDRRIVQNYRDRAGRVIDSQDEVGGYPKATPTRRALDVPKDPAAMDAWLMQYRQDVE